MPSPPAFVTDLLSDASRPLRALPALGVAFVLVLASVFVWLFILSAPGDRLSVTFLDVGQGDAILVHSPEGHKILVDGGPSGDAITTALGRHLPFWDRHLHLVVMTHPDEDHLTGLVEVLERYDVDQVLVPPPEVMEENGSPALLAWQEAVDDEGALVHEAAAGQWFDLGDGARLSIIHPPVEPLRGVEEDENSIVARVSMGDAAFLLTGDLGSMGESYLVHNDTDLGAAVLKLAHHGSKASSTPAFLDAVRPLTAVVSVGEGNRYGHPAPETLERLDGRPIFRTDLHGDVEITTDGDKLWVETQRGGE